MRLKAPLNCGIADKYKKVAPPVTEIGRGNLYSFIVVLLVALVPLMVLALLDDLAFL